MEEDDEVSPEWYQMNIAIGQPYMEKSASHNDLFEACVIREATGETIDTYYSFYSFRKKMDLTDQALVGLVVNEIEWLPLTLNDPIPETELAKMHFKLKIFACDDKEANFEAGR